MTGERSHDVLAFGRGEEDRPGGSGRSGRWNGGGLLAAVVGLLTAAVVGGVAYGVSVLSGGGSQPEDALPADAFLFVKVDLDPSAGQKLAARDFFREIPEAERVFGGDGDLRQALFTAIQDEKGSPLAGIDYAADVKPWLGKRVGMAMLPGAGEEPEAVVALQVSDDNAARAGIEKILDASSDDDSDRPGVEVRDGWALVADRELVSDYADRAAERSLAESSDFAGDLAALGEDGVATAWVDMGEVADLMKGAAQATGVAGTTGFEQLAGGRQTYALRFADGDLEIAGRVADDPTLRRPSTDSSTTLMQQLPADTLAALSVAGGNDLIIGQWERMTQALEETGGPEAVEDAVRDTEQSLGLRMPDDAATLLGDEAVLAVETLEVNGSPDIGVGFRSRTDPGAGARVAEALRDAVAGGEDQPFRLALRRLADGVALAHPEGHLDAVVSEGSW